MKDYCKNCGHELSKNTKFCPKCGKKVENKTSNAENKNFCPNCGETIEHNESFCEHCGTNLLSKQSPKQPRFIEKNKIPLIILAAIVVFAVVAIVAISLMPKAPVDVGTQVVTVGTSRFEIPGDYVIDPSSIDVEYTGYNAVFSQQYNNGKDFIGIAVMNIPPGVDGQEVLASEGGIEKNLMGVNGYYNEDADGYTFAFVDGAYLDVVVVTNPDLFDEITYLG